MRILRGRKGLFAAALAALLSIAGGYDLLAAAPDDPGAPSPAAGGAPPAPGPNNGAPPPPAAGSEGHEQVGTGDVDSPATKRADVSPDDMTRLAADYIHKMQDILKHIVHLQYVARQQKDILKLNCVNDKLLQVKQLLNLADQDSTEMTAAIAGNDEAGRYHHFNRVSDSYQQTTVLNTEAENCVGEDLTFLGPTEVTVDQPNEPDDPTQTEAPEIPEVEPPPVASPFI